MKPLLCVAFLCGLLSSLVFAQSLRQPLSALYPPSSAYSLYQHDVFSFMSNPASLAFTRKFSAGVYGERRFLLAELGVCHVAAAIPMGWGALGTYARYAGFSGYQETSLGIAYSRRLGEKAALGLQFNRVDFGVPGVVRDAAVFAELGALLRVAPRLTVGLHVQNPAGGFFARSDARLPSTFKLGMGFDASEKFHVNAELLKESDLPVALLAAFQYQFHQRFFIRAGINTVVGSGFMGFGLAWSGLRADVTGSLHPQLGFSPGFMLVSFPGNKSTNNPKVIQP